LNVADNCPATKRGEVLGYLGLAATFFALLVGTREGDFQRFFGGLETPVVLAVAIGAGAAALAYLNAVDAFATFRSCDPDRLLRVAALAILFGAIAIAADRLIVFPRDMNVPFPRSVFFYPVIGFIVEVAWHVVPLAVLLLVARHTSKQPMRGGILWLCMLVVATIEPAYQVSASVAAGQSTWAIIFVGSHVFLFNIAELGIFRRYDFMTMYLFRVLYYLIWHVGWGHLRLAIVA
jgi:hypothetical protein